jgi:hypothetical protein
MVSIYRHAPELDATMVENEGDYFLIILAVSSMIARRSMPSVARSGKER